MSARSRIAGIALGLLAGATIASGADPLPAQRQGSAAPTMSAWCRAFIEGYTSQPCRPPAPPEPERHVVPPPQARSSVHSGSAIPTHRSITFLPLTSLGSGRPAPQTCVPAAPPGSGLQVYPSPPWVAPGLRSYADAMARLPEALAPCAPANRPGLVYAIPPGASAVVVTPGAWGGTLRFLAPRDAPLP